MKLILLLTLFTALTLSASSQSGLPQEYEWLRIPSNPIETQYLQAEQARQQTLYQWQYGCYTTAQARNAVLAILLFGISFNHGTVMFYWANDYPSESPPQYCFGLAYIDIL